MRPIAVVLAGPDTDFRVDLRNSLAIDGDFGLVGETGRRARLPALLAEWQPDLLVLDAAWLADASDLVAQLVDACPGCRLMLALDEVDAPGVLAAIQQGVRGCVPRSTDRSDWLRALRAVHRGEIWIPRTLLAEALHDRWQRPPSAPQGAEPQDGLTERQREILRWVAQGLSNKEIGRRLGISPATVKTHLQNIFKRVGVSGRQRILAQGVPARSAG